MDRTDQLEKFISENISAIADKSQFINEQSVERILSRNLQEINPQMRMMILSSDIRQKNISNTFFDEMAALQKLFRDNNIRAAFMKGPILGEQLYQNSYLRATNDIDILADYRQTEKAMDLLGENGYTRNNNSDYSGKDFIYDFQKGHPRMRILGRHSSCIKQTNSFTYHIEVHITPFSTYDDIDNAKRIVISDIVFSHLDTYCHNGTTYSILGPIDNFLMLCCHCARHIVAKLSCYCHNKKEFISIGMKNIHDLAIYYDKFLSGISTAEIASSSKEYLCTADLAMCSKFLRDIYDIKLFDEIAEECLAASKDDIESAIYSSIAKNIDTKDLINGDTGKVLNILKSNIPPVATYKLQTLKADDIPIDDVAVKETPDESTTAYTPSKTERKLYSFRWGAGIFDNELILKISFDSDEVRYNKIGDDSYKADTNIQFFFPSSDCTQDCSQCVSLYEIDLAKFKDTLSAEILLNNEKANIENSVINVNGRIEIIIRLNINGQNPHGLRFSIFRNATAYRLHYQNDTCGFSIRWIDKVATSFTTCLISGVLK